MVGIFYIWQINPYGSYQLIGYFPHVGGLSGGSRIELMGVKVGEVVSLSPEGRKVKVVMNIESKIKLQKGSIFVIVTKGIVGDKALEIRPPEKDSPTVLAPGDSVDGIPPASLDGIFVEAQGMLKSARALVEDQALRGGIVDTIGTVNRTARQMEFLFKDIGMMTKDFKKITNQTDNLLAQINGITATAVPQIGGILGHTRQVAMNMEALSGRFNQLANDPALYNQARTSIGNINDLTQRWSRLTDDVNRLVNRDVGSITNNVKEITNDIKEITSDKDVKANVKSVAKNAKQLTDFFLNPAPNDKDRKTTVNFRAEAMGAVRLDRGLQISPAVLGNFNIFGNIGFAGPLSHYKVGLDEIGDKNKFNLQLGSTINDKSVLRFGIVRGKLGAGIDFNTSVFERPLTLSGEFYDINAPTVRLGVLQNLIDAYGVSAYWENDFSKGVNEFNIGFRWQPHN